MSELEENISNSTRQGAISPKEKLIACLRFFAGGSYQHCVGKDFNVNVAQPTFSKMLNEVVDSLEINLCSKWISLSMHHRDEVEAKLFFYEKSRIPGVTMVADGTQIKIVAPSDAKHLYFNRKGFYSINVLIVCMVNIYM